MATWVPFLMTTVADHALVEAWWRSLITFEPTGWARGTNGEAAHAGIAKHRRPMDHVQAALAQGGSA